MAKNDHKTVSIAPRKEPVQARSRERFEKILEGTVKLILETGADTVAMSEIAATADISIASLYQYFPDKTAIIATLAERYNSEGQCFVQKVFASVAQPDDLVPAIHAMIDGYHEFFRSVPGSLAIWQATQSDNRLQLIDKHDLELHANTISNALTKVMPSMPKAHSLRLGRLLTGTIAVTVRSAAIMDLREALASIDLCKTYILTPGIEKILTR